MRVDTLSSMHALQSRWTSQWVLFDQDKNTGNCLWLCMPSTGGAACMHASYLHVQVSPLCLQAPLLLLVALRWRRQVFHISFCLCNLIFSPLDLDLLFFCLLVQVCKLLAGLQELCLLQTSQESAPDSTIGHRHSSDHAPCELNQPG